MRNEAEHAARNIVQAMPVESRYGFDPILLITIITAVLPLLISWCGKKSPAEIQEAARSGDEAARRHVEMRVGEEIRRQLGGPHKIGWRKYWRLRDELTERIIRGAAETPVEQIAVLRESCGVRDETV